jgi:hypothetical protein
MVRDGNSGHSERRRSFHKFPQADRSVKKAVFRMKMEGHIIGVLMHNSDINPAGIF